MGSWLELGHLVTERGGGGSPFFSLLKVRRYLEWQVRQSALPVLLIICELFGLAAVTCTPLFTRKKLGLNTVPGPAEGTPWGSWQDAHSTSGPSPVSYSRGSSLSG